MQNPITLAAGQAATMSTIELRNLINTARAEFGEAKVRNDQLLSRVEDELEGELGVCKTFAHPQSGAEMRYYDLTLDQCMLVGMRESKSVRRAVLAKVKELQAAAPNFNNPAALARAWADAYERNLLLAQERDRAIATKAEIGTRREATAMNTASQAVKRANALEIELDKSKDYATVKRMQMLYHGASFDWRLLKNTGNAMGVDAIDVFDQNYGTVKAYHASVWREAYALGIDGVAV